MVDNCNAFNFVPGSANSEPLLPLASIGAESVGGSSVISSNYDLTKAFLEPMFLLLNLAKIVSSVFWNMCCHFD